MASTSTGSQFAAIVANTDYRWYAFGNFVSIIGLWIQRIAVGWLVWELSHSPFWLGMVALAETGPSILLGFPAGALLDRTSPLFMLRLTQGMTVAYSGVLALVTMSGYATPGLLCALILFRGIVYSVNRPARMTIVYSLVGREMLPSALALNATIFNTAKFIGPAVAGLAIWGMGVSWTLVLVVALQGVFTFALTRLTLDMHRSRPAATTSMREEIVDGLQYMWNNPGIRLQFMLILMLSVLAKPITELLPGFAGGIFQRDAAGLALMSFLHGIGATLGGVYLSLHASLLGLVFAAAVATIAMSASLLLFSSTSMYWLACALLLIIGFSTVIVGISSQTLIQSTIRGRYRGRVMSTYGMVAQGSPSVGAFGMGLIAQHFGLQTPVFYGALICLAGGIAAFTIRDRWAAMLEIPREEQAPEPETAPSPTHGDGAAHPEDQTGSPPDAPSRRPPDRTGPSPGSDPAPRP